MRITTKTCVSAPELAAVLGVTRRRVDQLAAEGMFRKVDSRFPLIESTQAYIAAKLGVDIAQDAAVEVERLRILTARRKLLEHEVSELQRIMTDPAGLLVPTFHVVGKYMHLLWRDVTNVWPVFLAEGTAERYKAQEQMEERMRPLWDEFARELEAAAPEPHRTAFREARERDEV